MSTARKKTKANLRSTDRGGSVLLPLGVLLIAFSWMLFIGATSQTQAGSLAFFKELAIGLAGGLYLVLPVFILWLGVLLMISSKRYVSFYPFIISFLLFLCLGAMINLTLAVSDRTFPRLMDYIKNANAMRQTPYPDSLGEYLKSSYSLHRSLNIAQGIYPGGGALSMLVSYIMYNMLGNTAGIVVLAIIIIALLFALFRISPVRLINQISEKANRVPGRPNEVRQAAQGEQQAAYQPEAAPQQQVIQQPIPQSDVWQGQPTGMQTDIEMVYPDTDTGHTPAYGANQGHSQVEPGFVAQKPATYFDDFIQSQQQAYQRTTPVWPAPEPVNQTGQARTAAWPGQETQKSPVINREGTKADVRPAWQAQPQPRQTAAETNQSTDETKDIGQTSRGRRARRSEESAVQTPLAPAHSATSQADPVYSETDLREPAQQKPVTSKTAIQPEPAHAETVIEQAPVPATDIAEGKPAATSNSAPKPVHTAPAVELTGERIPVKKREESFGYASLDGMVKKPAPQQIKLSFDDYRMPPMSLLAENLEEHNDTTEEDRARAEKLIETLKSFQVNASLHDIIHGPTVTRFAIRLAEGVNVSKLRNVMDNLTIELRAKGDIRAEMPIPGTSFVGLEVSNDKTSKVYLRDVLESPKMKENKSPTAVALGKDITGTPITCELMDMPHLLIAGATGSGKSVCINSIICSMLYRASPRNVRLIMVDPKFVELQPYNNVPHLWCPVITDAQKATRALEWVCQEMDNRYQIMVDAGVRNLDAYNRKLGPDEEPLPRIIVIVDEMADLMTTSGKMIEDSIKRITAKARAAGICLILATQRPSVNIITGVIKANIPGRIAFRVSSPFDSKTILDSQGAEKLLGYGDMLYRSMTREPIRVQGCFVSDHDVEQTVEFIRSRNKAEYNAELTSHLEKDEQAEGPNGQTDGEDGDAEFDELLPQAIEMAVEAGQMSISMLQRVLRVGYARSGRLIDEMTRRGIISGNEGTKPRRTLMTREQYMSYLEHGG